MVCIPFLTARVSLFGLVQDEARVREPGQVQICLEMLSSGPLLEDALFNTLGQNGSAVGKCLEHHQIVFPLLSHAVPFCHHYH